MRVVASRGICILCSEQLLFSFALVLRKRMLSTKDVPERYQTCWLEPFDALVGHALASATTVLDVGSGASPVVPKSSRRPGTTYVGLDVSASELRKAPAGSYDEEIVADAASHLPALDESFDAVVSWQVFEHLRPLAAAVENVRAYLRPGGTLVAHF